MPHISALKESKFLTKEDCGRGILVTIRDCQHLNVAKDGTVAVMKWCLLFNESVKPLVLNMTNAQLIAGICGSENTEDWTGHKIVLYHEPNVEFGGDIIGGIRVRAPRNQSAKPPAAPPAPPRQTMAAQSVPLGNNVPNGDTEHGHRDDRHYEDDIPF
jgi:hypothetical protein